MRFLANVIWFILAGLWSFIGYTFAGIVLCCTIIGIPFGIQMFKFAKLLLAPFGKKVHTNIGKHVIMNFIWIIFIGFWSFVSMTIASILMCVTIVLIPIGLQGFKIATLSLAPFGAVVE